MTGKELVYVVESRAVVRVIILLNFGGRCESQSALQRYNSLERILRTFNYRLQSLHFVFDSMIFCRNDDIAD